MPIKVLMDNNVPDFWEQLRPNQQLTFDRAFSSGRCSLYLCGEMLQETLAMVQSKRATKLPARLTWLRGIFRGRILRYYGDILLSELVGQRRPFLEASIARRLEALLRSPGALLDDTDLRKLADDCQADKAAALHDSKAIQARYRQLSARMKDRRPTYEELLAYGPLQQCEQAVLLELQTRLGVLDPALAAAKALSNRPAHPYLDTFLRAQAAVFHRSIEQNRKVKEGDDVDADQVVYMTGLDWLITHDKGMRDVFKLVFPNGKRVMTVQEFLRDLGLSTARTSGDATKAGPGHEVSSVGTP